ncbi:MAG: type IV pilus modification PilV family protein [Actinomycetota bacterium]
MRSRVESRSRRRIGKRGSGLIEVAIATMIMAMGILVFAGFYPTAAKSSKMSGSYSQAVSEVQHKVDQLRAIGYGRLNYTDLRAANVIDSTPNSSPFRFEKADDLSALLWDPIGTITVASPATDLAQVTISLSWRRQPNSTQRSSHAVTILITNE